jgi:hypothetical protein
MRASVRSSPPWAGPRRRWRLASRGRAPRRLRLPPARCLASPATSQNEIAAPSNSHNTFKYGKQCGMGQYERLYWISAVRGSLNRVSTYGRTSKPTLTTTMNMEHRHDHTAHKCVLLTGSSSCASSRGCVSAQACARERAHPSAPQNSGTPRAVPQVCLVTASCARKPAAASMATRQCMSSLVCMTRNSAGSSGAKPSGSKPI